MANSKSTEMVHAKKNGMPNSRFTRTVWDAMGADKNGWVEITSQGAKKGVKANVKADLSAENRYKIAMEKAGGFEQDGKADKAMAEYARAYAIDPTQEAGDGVKRMEEALAEALESATGGGKGKAKPKAKNATAAAKKGGEDDDLMGDTVLLDADAAFADEDYVLAKELYEAVEDQENEHVKERLAKIAELLAE